MSSAPFRYADLFAGIGGFAAVLEALGGEQAYSVEIDAAAAATYRSNWGHDPLGDITKDATDLVMRVPAHDVLVGGFPCQPFSKSGAQRGMDETRGTLFHNIACALRAHRPPVVILENVRNLVGPRHVHEWQVIIDVLHELGYEVSRTPAVVSPHQLAPHAGGAPQVRERVFITATYRPDGEQPGLGVAPIVLPESVRMGKEWNLRADLPLDEGDVPGTALSTDERTWISHWDEWVHAVRETRVRDAERAGDEARALPGFPVWANVWTTSQRERRELMAPGGVLVPSWKANFLEKNWDLYDGLRERGDAAWLTKWLKKTRTFPESRQKLEWQAQDATGLWECAISLRPSGIRAKRMTHLPALVAITQTPILGPLGRRLSTREAARLQGLPDEFDFGDQRDALTYKQLGNGVNTGVVWNVLKAHVERDAHLLQMTERGRAILDSVRQAPTDPSGRLARAVLRGQARAAGELAMEAVA